MNTIKKMKITGLLLTLLTLISCQVEDKQQNSGTLIQASPEKAGMSTDRLSRFDTVINYYIENHWIPGAVALVARHGKIVYYKSFGMRDIAANDPMEKDDIFRIASMSKAITSVAIMMLYEKGAFLLDDPVSKYIPEFKNPRVLVSVNEKDSTFISKPAQSEITIRELLTHTSGIGYGFINPRLKVLYDKAGIPDGFVTTHAILGNKIKLLAKMPLLHQPGKKFTYGLNMDVLGYLVEVISGKTFKSFLQKNIFDPIGMEDTYFYLPDEKIDKLAKVYADTKSGLSESKTKAYNYPFEGGKSYYSGGAGLQSTALDYAKFLQMLQNGGSYNGHQLLSRKTIDLIAMNQLGTLFGVNDFGLGFGITSEKGNAEILGSAGNYWWGGYFSTSFWVDPKEDLIAVLMVQDYPAFHGDIHKKFQVLVYQSLTDKMKN